MPLPFFTAKDIYDAALIARQKRVERHHISGLPLAQSWNELPGDITETYVDMADILNGLLEDTTLDIVHTLLTEGRTRASYRVKTPPESLNQSEYGRSH